VWVARHAGAWHGTAFTLAQGQAVPHNSQFRDFYVSKEYLQALKRGEATTGVAMATMVQRGHMELTGACRNAADDDGAGCVLFSEEILCPLARLEGLTAEHLLGAVRQQMPFTSSTTVGAMRLQLFCRWITIALLGDSASANIRMQVFMVWCRLSMMFVLPLSCQAHKIHTCSNNQIDKLDIPCPTSIEPRPKAKAAAARGHGRGLGGRGGRGHRNAGRGGRGGGDAMDGGHDDGAQEVDFPLLGSLVRGANLFRLQATWDLVNRRFSELCDERVRVYLLHEIDSSKEALRQRRLHAQANARLLLTLGIMPANETTATGQRKTRSSIARMFLQLVGESNWKHDEISIYEDILPPGITPQNVRMHVQALGKGLYLSRKPTRAATSRWNGVPDASAWFGALSCFHNFLASLTRVQAGDQDHQQHNANEPYMVDEQRNMSRDNSRRRSLFAKFAAAKSTPMKLYMTVRLNVWVRYPLYHILKHETRLRTSQERFADLVKQYRLGPHEHLAPEGDARARLVRGGLIRMEEHLAPEGDARARLVRGGLIRMEEHLAPEGDARAQLVRGGLIRMEEEDGDPSEHDDHAEEDAVESNSHGFLKWACGHVTGKALAELAMDLAGESSAEEDIIAIFAQSEVTLCMGRRLLLGGGAVLWWKAHYPTLVFPLIVFGLLDPTLSAEARQRLLHFIAHAAQHRQCCMDHGFTLPFIVSLGGHTEQDIVELLQSPRVIRYLWRLARNLRLSIYGIECDHGEVRKFTETSKHCGTAKSFEVFSAEHVLSGLKRDYDRMMMASQNDKEKTEAAPRPRGGRIRKQGRRPAVKQALRVRLGKKKFAFKTNGYLMFKHDKQRQYSNACVWHQQRAGAIAGRGDFELHCWEAWRALEPQERAMWTARARAENRARDQPTAGSRQQSSERQAYPWHMGDSLAAVRKDVILDARGRGLFRSSGADRMKASHASVPKASELTPDLDRATAELHVPCSRLGVCLQEYPGRSGMIKNFHRLLQKYLVGLNHEALRASDVCLCFRGTFPEQEDATRLVKCMFHFVGHQIFSPRFSIMATLHPEDPCEQVLERGAENVWEASLLPPSLDIVAEGEISIDFQTSMCVCRAGQADRVQWHALGCVSSFLHTSMFQFYCADWLPEIDSMHLATRWRHAGPPRGGRADGRGSGAPAWHRGGRRRGCSC